MRPVRILKKGGIGIYIAYNTTDTGKLYAYNISVASEPEFTLSLDLNPNLRKRNKNSLLCIDASDLARGEIHKLTLVQVHYDRRIFRGIEEELSRLPRKPSFWRLVILLDGEKYPFSVKPEYKANSLFLHVLSGK